MDPADPAQIVSAAQKDDAFVAQLVRDGSDGLLSLLGPKQWLEAQSWVEPAARLVYAAATTLSDYQTLGEEYAGVLQVDSTTLRSLPSKAARLAAVLMQSCGPVVAAYWIRRQQGSGQESLARWFSSFHVCLFYAGSFYYHLSKREA